MRFFPGRLLLILLFVAPSAFPQSRASAPQLVPTPPAKVEATPAAFQLLEIKKEIPTIEIELRYAGTRNIANRMLYPYGFKAVTRPEVIQRLAIAQNLLLRYNYSLKIWDAWRPRSVQIDLWKASRNNTFVADPNAGAGSLHSWGLAVDATLVDTWNRPVTMPTDFDDFTPAAFWQYRGGDPAIRGHLHLLQSAMAEAGFYGLRAEWWHFTVDNWAEMLPPEEAQRAKESMGLVTSAKKDDSLAKASPTPTPKPARPSPKKP